MPALETRYPITRPDMKKAATVATPHATREMMSIRRSASRCSMTDMRGSSTGARERGARCRTLLSKATGKPASARRGISLGRRALGGALRACRGGRRRGLRLRLGCRGDLVGQLRGRLAELTHRFADGTAELRQPAGAEDDQNDDQQDDDPDPVRTEHLEPIIGAPPSGQGQRRVRKP